MSAVSEIKRFIEEGESTVQNREISLNLEIPQKNTTKNIINSYNDFNKTGLLLLPIILFEIFVCVRGYEYYHSALKFPIYGSIAVSLCVESFYMFYSSKRGFKESLMKYLFLSISIFTLGFSTYKTDPHLTAYINNQTDIVVEKNKSIELIDRELQSLEREKKTIDKTMEVYLRNERVTKGTKMLTPRLKELDKKFIQLNKSREKLVSEVYNVKNNASNLEITKQFKLLSSKTLITILVFFLLQLAICFSLSDIVDSFKISHKSTTDS